MKVVRIDFREIPTLEASAACIGYFDGMHNCLLYTSDAADEL